MKQKISLASSTSILIGAVIAILALLRGPVQTVLLLLTFALWGLWVVVTLLRPSWRANRDYRRREERAEKQQNAFSGKNLAGLLLCHVNYRVSDYLKRAYPDARWEWMMPDPVLFIVQGGIGRIRVYGVPDYEYLDHLRDSGVTNMFGAVPYLKSRFFELYVDEARAREVLKAWMDSRSGR